MAGWNPSEREWKEYQERVERERVARGEPPTKPAQPSPQPHPEEPAATTEPKEEPGTARKFYNGVKEGLSSVRTLSKPGEVQKRMPAAKAAVVAGAKAAYRETARFAKDEYKRAGGASGIAKSVGAGAMGAAQRGSDRMIQSDKANFYKQGKTSSEVGRKAPAKIKKYVEKTYMKKTGGRGLQSTLPTPAMSFFGGVGSPAPSRGVSQPRRNAPMSFNSLPGWSMGAAPQKKATPTKARQAPAQKKSMSVGIGIWGALPTIGGAPTAQKKTITGKSNPLFSWGPIPKIGFSAPVKKAQTKKKGRK